jgi:hypothetical protein
MELLIKSPAHDPALALEPCRQGAAAGFRIADRGASPSPVVVEVQREANGRASGALHLPLGSAMSIERDASGETIGVEAQAADV